MEGLTFMEYRTVGKEVYAHFTENEQGLLAVLSYDDCVKRLANLKANNFCHEVTEEVVANWPKFN